MSTCEQIMSKLDSIDSKLGNIKLGQEVVDKINSIDSNMSEFITAFNQFQEDFASLLSEQFDLLTTNQIKIAQNLVKISDNQISNAERAYNISNGIKKLAEIGKANNDSLKGLAMSNGSLPSSIVQQIANIEAVCKALNFAILK